MQEQAAREQTGLEPSSPAALVTGAAKRLGRRIAERLAAAGYRLALHCSEASRPQAEELASAIRRDGGTAEVFAFDLADLTAVSGAMKAIVQKLGPMALLVNNAALFERDDAAHFSPALWERHFAVNLRAPIILASDFVAQVPQDNEAVIVNIVDQRVWHLSPQFFSYTLSKSALWTATLTMAQAFAPRRIRVNAVGPGPVLPNHQQGLEGFEQEVAGLPLGRAVTPDEIAEAVLYLAQARNVTGQMIAVDAGQHIAWQTPDIIG
ncbi:SDR family oxidoreductase [Beijerinckia indica]|uniref:Short-chain dehydrogenase/reductase SDR n=1 Tax=Beijerinckia indica subsp. indica (strain ATCC 9039 / DSM 1715 / NCIMB 8712) TaxID=395963 RepID=B2IKJ4_BEII9|nr:SDR family oxidoreductase [Beijerinckia indica]ACB96474.1 short-chain dehydrogenase/reductase SDR [Beijerinckia indica subsp. indica ATCC 9039]